MKVMTKKEQLNAVGGADKHWHWFCDINRFVSNKHATFELASLYARRHVGRYPSHAGHVSVGDCTNSW